MSSVTLTQEFYMPPVNPQASIGTKPLIMERHSTPQQRGRFSLPTRAAVVGLAYNVAIIALVCINNWTDDLEEHFPVW